MSANPVEDNNPDGESQQEFLHIFPLSVPSDSSRSGGTLHGSSPNPTSIVQINRGSRVWIQSGFSSHTQSVPETLTGILNKSEKEKCFGSSLQSQELELKTCRCQRKKAATAQSSHTLCKLSESVKRENTSSEESSNDHARDQFINDILLNYLNLVAKKINSPVVDRFLQSLKELGVDLDHIIKQRESGTCMEKVGKLLDTCIQTVVIDSMDTSHNSTINSTKKTQHIDVETEDRDAEDSQSTRYLDMPCVARNPQQTSCNIPRQITEETNIPFSQWVKQEPFGYNVSPQANINTERNSLGENAVSLKNMSIDSKPTRKSAVHTEEDGQSWDQPMASIPTRKVNVTKTTTDRVSGSETELIFSHARDRRQRDQTITPSSEKMSSFEKDNWRAQMVQDLPRAEMGDSVRLTEDVLTVVDDAEYLSVDSELSLRVPEDDDNLQITQDGVTIFLLRSSMWQAFAEVGTEMIINRSGRRMFPFVSVRLTGLQEREMYELDMEVVPADNLRYKFNNTTWTAVGVADNPTFNLPYLHPESPNSGKHWMTREIHFTRVKLTNNKASSEGNMLLNSLHKYVVQITVRQLPDIYINKTLRSFRFRLDLTSFIAVTAYQNDLVKKLKIHNNPFAKAFRESNLPLNNKRGTAKRRHYDFGDADRLAQRTKKPNLEPHGDLSSICAQPAGVGGAVPGVGPFFPSVQPGQARMTLLQPQPAMWLQGIPPPWIGLGQGMSHPCYYNLPHQNSASGWVPHTILRMDVFSHDLRWEIIIIVGIIEGDKYSGTWNCTFIG